MVQLVENMLERNFDLQAQYLYIQLNLKYFQKLNILFTDLWTNLDTENTF